MQLPRETLTASLQAYIDQIPFVRPLGILVNRASKGSVSLKMRPQKGLQNHLGTYQAGSIFTLAEAAGGTLCGTFLDLSNNLLITRKGEIAFLKATDQELIAEANLEEVLIQGALTELKESKKVDVPVLVSIQTTDGESVAACNFIYYLRLGIPRQFSPKPSSMNSYD